MTDQQISVPEPKGIQEDERSLLIDYYIQKVSGRLRQLINPGESDRKRWIWELLQNAKDSISNAAIKKHVDVEITLNEDYLIFKHNGEPFTSKALNSLIWQKSGDKRGNYESTGRFGTGFLTTHTLSQTVFLESILIDADGIKWGVRANLHREGDTDEELRAGIEKTLNSRQYFAKPENDWTTYKYYLKSKQNQESALAGIQSLESNIFFALAFAEKINSIRLNTPDRILYVVREEKSNWGELEILRFSILRNNHPERMSVLMAKEDAHSPELTQKFKQKRNLRITAAIQLDENKKILLPTNNDTPRLSCVFPLVGTEDFHFPVILDSPDFEPVAERDRLLLLGDELNTETNEVSNVGINRMILERSLNLYEKMLKKLSDGEWSDIHFLARGARQLPQQERDFDKEWYQNSIQQKIRRLLLDTPIVETEKGLQKILNESGQLQIWFPKGKDKHIRKKIWEFTTKINPGQLPKLELVDAWHSLVWEDCNIQSIQELAKQVSDLASMDMLNIPNDEKILWINDLLKFISENNPEYLKEYSLIPNYYGIFKPIDYENFSRNNGLPPISLLILDTFKIDWRDILLMEGIEHVSITSQKGVRELSNLINEEIQKRIKNVDDRIMSVACVLNSIIPNTSDTISSTFREKRNLLWQFSKSIFGSAQPDQVQVDGLDMAMWDKCDEWFIEEMIKFVSAQQSITELQKINSAIDIYWINEFIGFVSPLVKLDILNLETHKILPNQLGKFTIKSKLSRGPHIPEAFKDPAFVNIGINLQEELIDDRISSFFPDREIEITQVASRINDLLKAENISETQKNSLVLYLLSLFPKENSNYQKEIWSYAKAMYGNQLASQTILTYYHSSIWEVANTYILNKIIYDIEQLTKSGTSTQNESSLMILADHLKKNALEGRLNWFDYAAIWLSEFIEFLHKQDLRVGQIIPNQNNNFCEFLSLYQDIDIPSELKNILLKLAPQEDYRDFLIHEAMSLQPSHSKDTREIANKINDLIRKEYKESGSVHNDDFKDAVKSLVIDWFNRPNYPSELYKEYGDTATINSKLFNWTYSHRFELETNVLSTVDERRFLYGLNNKIRELEIPFEDIEIITKAEYNALKDQIENLREDTNQITDKNVISQFNLTEEKIKFLLEVEEKTKQFEGTSDVLERTAHILIEEIGLRGEEIVYNYLSNKFGSKRVVWVSRSDKNTDNRKENRYDFEVLTEDLNEVMHYIDAKATSTSETESDKIPLFIRRGTWQFLKENETSKQQIFLARVFNVNKAGMESIHMIKIQYQSVVPDNNAFDLKKSI